MESAPSSGFHFMLYASFALVHPIFARINALWVLHSSTSRLDLTFAGATTPLYIPEQPGPYTGKLQTLHLCTWLH